MRKISELTGLTTKDVFSILSELENIISKLKPKELISYNEPQTLWILSTSSCNLKCRYCYTASGTFNIMFPTLYLNTEEVIKTIDIILDAFPFINLINFFGGGEPLLTFNLIAKVVKHFADKIKVGFGIVTNATILGKEIIDFLYTYKDKISITVSIDGPQIVHDINRVYPDGRGSYRDVMRFIEKLKEKGIRFSIEVTYTLDAYELGYSIIDVVRWLSRLSPIIIKASEYVKSLKTGVKTHLPNLGHLYAEYVTEAFKELTKDKPKFYDVVILYALSYIARKATKVDICPYTGFITIMPNGNVITCHMLTDYVLANIKNIKTRELKEKWKELIKTKRRISDKIDPRHKWLMAIQDIRPGELFTGLKSLIELSTKNEYISIPIDDLLVLKEYWDSFIANVYKYTIEGRLNTIYRNVEKVLQHALKRSKTQEVGA